jgi:hypothetical protein
MTLDEARARYVSDVQRVHPVFDDQLREVLVLQRSLLGGDAAPGAGALDNSRADYLAQVRDRCRTVGDQLRELAQACSQLFASVLGIDRDDDPARSTPLIPSSRRSTSSTSILSPTPQRSRG